TQKIDYFVYGHRHLPMVLDLGQNSKYINLGDWISYFTYGVFEKDFELKVFDR
ncbi:MAG: UDP-2,3-diacylglucosamine diphosphatase, partial [Chryseobacterium artocarpi]